MTHCWVQLNGKLKWANLFKYLKNPIKKMKNDDGTSYYQSIGLDDDEPSGGDKHGTELERNIHLTRRKWEKDRVAHDDAASKMSVTWAYIFCNKGETLKKIKEKRKEKERRYMLFLAVQRGSMEFDRETLG